MRNRKRICALATAITSCLAIALGVTLSSTSGTTSTPSTTAVTHDATSSIVTTADGIECPEVVMICGGPVRRIEPVPVARSAPSTGTSVKPGSIRLADARVTICPGVQMKPDTQIPGPVPPIGPLRPSPDLYQAFTGKWKSIKPGASLYFGAHKKFRINGKRGILGPNQAYLSSNGGKAIMTFRLPSRADELNGTVTLAWALQGTGLRTGNRVTLDLMRSNGLTGFHGLLRLDVRGQAPVWFIRTRPDC